MGPSRTLGRRDWGPAVLTSVAALATAFLPRSALAQNAPVTSFNASDPRVVSGTVTFDRGGNTPGAEVYTVRSPRAVLDFTPNDAVIGGGPINFQNAGTSVRFVNAPGVANYTVLNRIVPTDPSRPIVFNGSVISQLRSGVTTAPGGTVWFYSPGGIMLGSTAVFDIGSLLLTSADPTGGTGVIASETRFSGGGRPGSGISLATGASITVSPEGSYVAMVAPSVIHRGTVRVNGSAAYVAAEAATLSIDNGLFDIAVTVGTDTGGGAPLQHLGSTTGPASTGAGDPHGVYMVTVPKNDAITLLLGENGRVGFDIADTLTVENGRIILSAGRNVSQGAIEDRAGPSAAPANLRIEGGRFSSDVTGRATTTASAASTAGTATFAGDLFLQGGAVAEAGARRAGETMRIGGSLTLTTTNGSVAERLDRDQRVQDVAGGRSTLLAENGGRVEIAGAADILALGVLDRSGGTATGGEASILADGGSVTIGGRTSVSAAARAVNGATRLSGGRAAIDASRGGSVILNSTEAAVVSAAASGVVFGDLAGGSARTRALTDSRIATAGDLIVTASADGRVPAVSDGDAQGGTAEVASGGRLAVGGSLQVDARAYGGEGGGYVGGDAQGGLATLAALTGGAIDVQGGVLVATGALGGAASDIDNGAPAAGQALGGTSRILSDGAVTLRGLTEVEAGGTGGANRAARTPSAAGLGAGGRAVVSVGTGSMELTRLTLNASGTGGVDTPGIVGTAAGEGRGGLALIETTASDSRLSVAGATSLNAAGVGGQSLSPQGVGGRGVGGGLSLDRPGGAQLSLGGGAVTLGGDLTLSAAGRGGLGADGGSGAGGDVAVIARVGALTVSGATRATAEGFGGSADTTAQSRGRGGAGSGGEVVIGTEGATAAGSIRLGETTLSADAFGGSGRGGSAGSGAAGGAAEGGAVTIVADAAGGPVIVGSLLASANATGGRGGDGAEGFAGGAGGRASAGSVRLSASRTAGGAAGAGALTLDGLALQARATGGVGGGGLGSGGEGGDASGGTISVSALGGRLSGGATNADVGAAGGEGGSTVLGNRARGPGGDGSGGTIRLTAEGSQQDASASRLALGAIQLVTSGLGGEGAEAGVGRAGGAQVRAVGAPVTLGALTLTTRSAVAGPDPELSLEARGADLTVAGALNASVRDQITLNVRDGGALRLGSATLAGATLRPEANDAGTPGVIDVTGPFSSTFGTGLTLVPNLRAGGAITLTGGAVTTADLTSSSSDVRVAGRTISVGAVRAGDSINLNAFGALNAGPLTAALATSAARGRVQAVSSTGAVTLGDVRAAEIDIDQGDGADAAAAALRTGNLIGEAITVTGMGAVTLGDVTSTDLYPTLTPVAGPQTTLSAGGDLRSEDISSLGAIVLASRTGGVQTGNLEARQSVAVFAARDISLGVGTTLNPGFVAGDTVFVSGAGLLSDPLLSGYDDRFRLNGAAFDQTLLSRLTPAIAAGSTVRLGGVAAGVLTVAGDNVTLFSARVARSIALRAQNFIATSRPVTAPDIALTSGDISIAPTSVIGDANTRSLTLTSIDPTRPMTVGGNDQTTGYHLDLAEARRLRANRIEIRAATGQDGSGGVVRVDDLDLVGSAAVAPNNLNGADASWRISGSVVRIDGAVGLSGAAATDQLVLTGTRRVEVVTDQGGAITLTGPAAGQGQPAPLTGTLSLEAPVIAIAATDVVDRLTADPRFSGRDAVLSAPAANPRPEGYVQAGRLVFTPSNVLAVQNSGSATLAAGVTAGSGGLEIRTPPAAQTGAVAPQITLFGRIQRADGGFAENLTTLAATTLAPGANNPLDPTSSVNTCRVGAICPAPVTPDPPVTPPVTPDPPVPEPPPPPPEPSAIVAVEELLASNQTALIDVPTIPFVRVVDQDGLIIEPIITEPVSGAGNPSLWDDDEEAEEEATGEVAGAAPEQPTP